MNFFHLYVVHVSVWISFIVGAEIYKRGGPRSVKGIFTLVVAATILSLIMGLISSHGHNHYLTYLSKVSK